MNRRAITELYRNAQLFLFERGNRMRSEAAEKTAKDWLKPHIIENGETDENGHKFIDFDTPLEIGGEVYRGLTARKSDVPYLDTDAIFAYAEENGLLDEIRFVVPEHYDYDWEAVYVLNQEGKIPDEVLDSFTRHRVSWSLWPR